MNRTTGACVLLPTTVLAFWVIAPPTTGYAQIATESAAQFWRNEQKRQAGYFQPDRGYGRRYDEYRPRALPYWERPRYRDRDLYEPEERRPSTRAPQVQVESPQYHSYVPDALRSMRFDKLCELEVASRTVAPVSPVTGLFAEACTFAPSIVLRVLPEVGKAIGSYYAQHPGFLWIGDGSVTAKARAAMALLARSDRVGLLPGEYRVELPDGQAGGVASKLKAIMRFELALSAKVLTYALDVTRGRIDPNRISEYHDLPRKRIDLVKVLTTVAQSQDIASDLEQRNPGNPQFRALVAELEKLRGAATQPPVAIAEGTFIHPGDSDAELANVIAAIRRTGSPALRNRHAKALARDDSPQSYTRGLVALVRDFQRENGLHADGIIGRNTIRAMTRDSTADKIKKAELAMERLRWLPRDFGTRYVFLNQPAFEATYFDGSKTPLSMRVIIGKQANQTYFFTDRIKTVEYNPYWGVPRSIIVNEMLPKLYRDPSYLDRLGYEVTTQAGRRVSSRNIDWDRVAYDKLSVNVRQPPGRKNALGRLKIDFPNKHAIYMHDTPNKSLFNQQRRAFSHGCVRLHHPRVMAAAILGKTVDYVESRISAGNNSTDRVDANISVYLAYFTAWPDAEGVVRYYDDVYERDDYLSRALAKTKAARAGL